MTIAKEGDEKGNIETDWHATKVARAEAFNKAFARQAAANYQRRQRDIAETRGIDIGDGEHLYLETTLYSSERGIIRRAEPDYPEKLAQWRQADEVREDL